MKNFSNYFNLILDCLPIQHSLTEYTSLLCKKGALIVLGVVSQPCEINIMSLLGGYKRIEGSQVGSTQNLRELINFCAEKNITPETVLITSDQIDETYNKLTSKNNEIIRYVIDIKSSLK